MGELAGAEAARARRELAGHSRRLDALERRELPGRRQYAGFDRSDRLVVGIGGTPEGIITACAVKVLGGVMQGQWYPRNDEEQQKAIDAGHDLEAILGQDEVVTTDNCFFVATGVTDGGLCQGVRVVHNRIQTDSVVLRAHSGTLRRVIAEHLPEKWL